MAELTAFWVAPESRGLGVVAALVASAARWARTLGITTLHAWVVGDNHRAIGFYHKAGFQTTDQRQPHTPDPTKQIILLTREIRLDLLLGAQNVHCADARDILTDAGDVSDGHFSVPEGGFTANHMVYSR